MGWYQKAEEYARIMGCMVTFALVVGLMMGAVVGVWVHFCLQCVGC